MHVRVASLKAPVFQLNPVAPAVQFGAFHMADAVLSAVTRPPRNYLACLLRGSPSESVCGRLRPLVNFPSPSTARCIAYVRMHHRLGCRAVTDHGVDHSFALAPIRAATRLSEMTFGKSSLTINFAHPRQFACSSQNATLRRYASRSSGTPEPPSSTPSALRSMVIGTIGISAGSVV